MSDALRMAFTGLHPDRQRVLISERGSVGSAVRAIRRGQIRVPDSARDAAGADIADHVEALRVLDVRFLAHGDSEYPSQLQDLPDAAVGLFVKGRIPQAPAVAVVGTRRCTTYGRKLARRYGAAIAEAGWVLVSGLARGIDAAAHQGTVSAGGRGVAVLGSGIDVVYPGENAGLATSLVEGGGAVVSEYPPGTVPEPWRFPPRNRIISGLAAAVVVVEAAVTGGALITAGTALVQDRPVFAVPGDVDRATSEGTNKLIRDGAHPVLDPDDLIEELSLVLGPPGC
ncbi:MAG: DNA-protecting protein DprA [Acidimicrobiia bacterium]|nr:DNA-protecting protein DprA [Acidimicrobiia bacterium]